MATKRIIPGEIRIFLNHIYELRKVYVTWYFIQ